MGACSSLLKKSYVVSIENKIFVPLEASNVLYDLPKFKQSFLLIMKKNYIQDQLQKQADSQKLQSIMTDLDQKIAQAKNEEYMYVQKIKQLYYQQTLSQQKEIQALALNIQQVIEKLNQERAQQSLNSVNYVQKINDLKQQITSQKSQLQETISLLRKKMNYSYYKTQYDSQKAALKSLVDETNNLVYEYKQTPEFIYSQQYIKNQQKISLIQKNLQNEAIRFQQVFSNINYFDKQTYQYLTQIKDKTLKRLSSQKNSQIYFWEDKQFNEEILKLNNYQIPKEIKPQKSKEIYIQEGNYGYYDDHQQWIFVVYDQQILNDHREWRINQQDVIIQDSILNENNIQIQQEYALIFDNANIEVEIAQITNVDAIDFGNIDPGVADIANFQPADFACIDNYGAANDYGGGNDGGHTGDGGGWGGDGGGWGGDGGGWGGDGGGGGDCGGGGD